MQVFGVSNKRFPFNQFLKQFLLDVRRRTRQCLPSRGSLNDGLKSFHRGFHLVISRHTPGCFLGYHEEARRRSPERKNYAKKFEGMNETMASVHTKQTKY